MFSHELTTKRSQPMDLAKAVDDIGSHLNGAFNGNGKNIKKQTHKYLHVLIFVQIVNVLFLVKKFESVSGFQFEFKYL